VQRDSSECCETEDTGGANDSSGPKARPCAESQDCSNPPKREVRTAGVGADTPAGIIELEIAMSIFRALWIALVAHYAGARAVNGGSGHYNEQCHPGTYG